MTPAGIPYRTPEPTAPAVPATNTVTPTVAPEPMAPAPLWLRGEPEARAIEEFFARRGAPLAAHAALMVEAATRYDIDWRLMPVIAVLESGGGIHACGGNAWGWGSCNLRPLGSFEEGIELVAATLAAPPYAGMSTETALCIWVSGRGCSNAEASEYARKGVMLADQLEELSVVLP